MMNSCCPFPHFGRRIGQGLRSIALNAFLAAGLVLLLNLPSFADSDTAWWDSAWLYRSPVTVQNASSTIDLPGRYSVKLTMDTALPIRAGQLLPNCGDLRILYFDGNVSHELDRIIDNCGTSQTEIWFSLQRPIPATSQDTSYYVYFGNPSAGLAPRNGMNVFLFYEDWENGIAHWTNAGGLDVANSGTMGTSRISSDTALSPTQSQEFPQKAMGGDAFTGFIPVTPNTRYEISVWATSATAAYFPVGFDPYTAGYGAGSEVWLWTSEWTLNSQWSQRAGSFTTDGATSFLKIKTEWWTEGPGSAPVFSDNLRLRYAVESEPTVAAGTLEAVVSAPTIANLQGTSPVNSGDPTSFSADVSQAAGFIDRVTVHLLSPQTADIPMNLTSGTDSNGNWVAQYTVPRRGVYTYVLSARASNGSISVSTPQNFTVVDTLQSSWWDHAWLYRVPVMVQNTSSSSTLPSHYSVKLIADTGLLVRTGQLLPNCNDLRVVYFDGDTSHELDRLVESCAADQTAIWFASQRPIAAGTQDTAYYVYYGNSVATNPPNDGMHVFLFYEDWEKGSNHWTSAGGLDASNSGTMGTTVVSTDAALSPAQSQKFALKTTGGDAFSGFIPVTANTRYEVSLWAASATPAYLPVGFDPYSAGYSHGPEVWLWTSEWTLTSQWIQRSATFTTDAATAFLKIKSEWWNEGPGSAAVYSDNLRLRYAFANEPTAGIGSQETTVTIPNIANVRATSPVQAGGSVTVSADISQDTGTIDGATVHIFSPQTLDIPMQLVQGNSASGTWSAQFVASEGAVYRYTVSAHATTGTAATSPYETFTVVDTISPAINLVSIINPIPIKNTQTITVQVTDNGQISSVSVSVDGTTHPMVPSGNQYSYSWKVLDSTAVTYLVQAIDTSGNNATLSGSFSVQPREADVCTWHGCKLGAESFSIDDSVSACRQELETAGFRGTYYYSGNSVSNWLADYNAAGHEIGSHTVNHTCNTPCCTPYCTIQTLYQCQSTPDQIVAYRQNEFEPNIAEIESETHKPVLTAAWPCGCTDPGRQSAAVPYFLGARGYYDYIAQLTWVENVNDITPAESMNLYAAHAYDQTFIDRAAAEGKWAIIVSHGACDGIDYMGQRQDVLWAAPIGEVLKYIKVRDATNFNNYVRSGNVIAFDVSHTLSTFQRQKLDGTYFLPTVYDNPVTLMVHVLDTEAVLSVQVNGSPVVYSVQRLNGSTFVLFDSSLEIARHVVVTVGSAPAISSINLTPATVTGGNPSTGTVTLRSPAPAGGAVVTLLSSNVSLAQIAPTIQIGAGSTSASFPITTSGVAIETTVTISATYRDTTQSANLTLSPIHLVITSVVLNPDTVVSGNSSTATVTLSGPAPSQGATISLTSDDPAATVPSSVVIAANQTSAPFPVATTLVSVDTSANIIAGYNGDTTYGTLALIPVTVSSLSVSPTSLVGGNGATGTVTLSVVAPASGAMVALTSSDPAVQVPPNVTIAANTRSANFGITTNVVSADTAVTVSGNYNNTARSATLTVRPVPPVPATLALNPTSVIGGTSSTATVTLNKPSPIGGTVVALSSNNSAAHVPASVTVAGNASTATFTITTSPVRTAASATITASANSGAANALLTVNPASLAAISLNPTALVGGANSTATVTLNGPAPSGGAQVTLTSTNTAVAQVPSSVTIAANANSTTFTVTTRGVGTITSVTISATYSSVVQSAGLTVNPPSLSSLSLNPTSVVGGSSSTATVGLTGVAPSGGITVGLTTSNPAAAQIPASITIAAGNSTAQFPVTTVPVASSTSLQISASLNGVSRSATLTVAAPTLSSLSLNPTSIVGGNSSTGTVTLTGNAAVAIVVSLTSNNTGAASVPVNVTVPVGSSGATFTVSTNPVSSTTAPTISAVYSGTTRNQTLTVNSPSLSSLTLNPSTVRGGSPSTGTVTLNGRAPAGGTSVSLSSSNSSVATVPSSVTVPSGSTSATFTVTSRTVTYTRTVTISGTRNGTRSATLTVTR